MKRFFPISYLRKKLMARKLTEIEMFVVNKVREKRQAVNLSQAELAFKLNVSLGFIGQVESLNYSAKYNLNHINQLAIIFNCSPKEFLPENHF